ncbi:MAG: hypothetical protein R3F11_02775 [Verrucomicrobiales bacterium]
MPRRLGRRGGVEGGGVVTNGMSSYARAEANANSGFTDVRPEDYGGTAADPLASKIRFQRDWERRAFGSAAPTTTRLPSCSATSSPTAHPPVRAKSIRFHQPGVTDRPQPLPARFRRRHPPRSHPPHRRNSALRPPDAVLTAPETAAPPRLHPPRPGIAQCQGIEGLFPPHEGGLATPEASFSRR